MACALTGVYLGVGAGRQLCCWEPHKDSMYKAVSLVNFPVLTLQLTYDCNVGVGKCGLGVRGYREDVLTTQNVNFQLIPFSVLGLVPVLRHAGGFRVLRVSPPPSPENKSPAGGSRVSPCLLALNSPHHPLHLRP